MTPEAFVKLMIEEMQELCRIALECETGSVDQRVTFEEMADIASALSRPTTDNIAELKLKTTNEALYRLEEIDFCEFYSVCHHDTCGCDEEEEN